MKSSLYCVLGSYGFYDVNLKFNLIYEQSLKLDFSYRFVGKNFFLLKGLKAFLSGAFN